MQSADVVGPVDEGATGRLAAAQLRARVGGGRDEDSGVRAGREAGEAEEGGVGKVVGVASRRLCGQTAQREQGEERRQGEHDASEGRRSPRPKKIDDDKISTLCAVIGEGVIPALIGQLAFAHAESILCIDIHDLLSSVY